MHRSLQLYKVLIAIWLVDATAASADVYSDIAQVFNTTSAVVKSWLPPYYAGMPSDSNTGKVVTDSPVVTAQIAKDTIVVGFRQQNGRAPTNPEALAGLAHNLDSRFEIAQATIAFASESQRAIAAINEYYTSHLGRLASDREALYWMFRASYAGLKTVRYEIATSREAGKTLKTDRHAIPLGNKKYVTDGPKQGYLYTCDAGMYNFTSVIGARVVGPWVGTTSYDVTAKPSTQGAVLHSGGFFGFSLANGLRIFNGNGLPPRGIPTGVFPISPSDPTDLYDSNPNGYVEQRVSFSIPVNPVLADKPICAFKEVGITLTGLEITGPLDSSGRDEPGIEVQDDCGGTAQPGGLYHYHGQPNCMPHAYENEALLGYALDGFGIYSSFDANGKELTTADLDECHGRTSPVLWEGQVVTMYHYVVTADYPYVVGCFKGKPNWTAFPPLPRPKM